MTSVVTGCNGINGDIMFMPAYTLEAAVGSLRTGIAMCSDDEGCS